MPVVLRLTRCGTKRKPFYRIVAADNRFPRDGRFLEMVGTYDPRPKDKAAVKINKPKIEKWLKVGARPSNTVKNILKSYQALGG